ncbi:alpha/beta hydrolase [uncultured Paenibacillus sp.]|uniref:alpha/beta hydrolase n=1 Tax=uncultured Paenibacillus sp. TaxID=227322 RepID=UPI0015B06F1B|nr:alpha/beta fold hydrolase [uncultured Paenibacillus sp.]
MMRVRHNVSYSAHDPDSRLMDIWQPKERNGAAILFIHGGGWEKGDKMHFADLAKWFAEHGYLCASMNYRLSQQAIYPAAIEDARLAVQYLRERTAEYGFDSGKLAVVGSSAGGYLAAMLALIDPEDELGRTEELRMRDTRPNAAALYCPVTTLHKDQNFIRKFMGAAEADAPDLYREGSPMDRIKGKSIPWLIVQGDRDKTTPLEDAQAFVRKLAAAGSRAELLTLAGVGHGFGYGIESEAQRQACRGVLRFLQSVFA